MLNQSDKAVHAILGVFDRANDAGLAYVKPVALLRAFTDAAPQGRTYDETLQALQQADVVEVSTLKAFGFFPVTACRLTVKGERVVDRMKQLDPAQKEQQAIATALTTAAQTGTVDNRQLLGIVGPARALATIEALIGAGHLQKKTTLNMPDRIVQATPSPQLRQACQA